MSAVKALLSVPEVLTLVKVELCLQSMRARRIHLPIPRSLNPRVFVVCADPPPLHRVRDGEINKLSCRLSTGRATLGFRHR